MLGASYCNVSQSQKHDGDEDEGLGHLRLVPILAGSLFYVTVTFSFLLVYDTSKKSGISPPKIEGLE